jgi:hypothetical protein
MAAELDPMEVLASGSVQRVGHFHYDLVGEWTWDDELYRMHGYEPGEITVDLGLILSHKHPDDRAKASQMIETALRDGEPFSSYQRIITTDGSVRNIVKVGAGVVDEHMNTVALDGFYVDVTPSVDSHAQQVADQAVAASSEHRAAIEQAKGMLRMTYSIDGDAAFAMLRYWSMQNNIKLSVLAERLVAAGTEHELVHPHNKLRVDRLLEEITGNPERIPTSGPDPAVLAPTNPD